jgi:geranylgeranyl reductase
MNRLSSYDAVVVGGGPAGATAASTLAQRGLSVLLIERNNRIKPCGGAVPPRLIEDFRIPRSLLKACVDKARIVSPSGRRVDMPIDNGYVGMVDRQEFDEWLRQRAQGDGADRETAAFERLHRQADGWTVVEYRCGGRDSTDVRSVRTKIVIGADGANSMVASQGLYNAERMSLVEFRDEVLRFVPGDDPMHQVAAYHEIVAAPKGAESYDPCRCEVFYDSRLSPDFYAWVFPHGDTISVGVGSAQKGFSLRRSVDDLRRLCGLDQADTVRREGATIPLHPLRRWDNQQNVVVAGDAAGVVAPASGEGIYYAMLSGALAAQATSDAIAAGNPKLLARARKRFMREHGQVFRMLGMMQRYWYISDDRRERFVSICQDRDVQQLTWTAYMNKKLTRARPVAHARIFFKNIGHLTGLASPTGA